MGYKLVITKDAHEDIHEIIGYIVNGLKNTQAAADLMADMEASYGKVVQNPYIYSLCNNKQLEILGYRKIVIKNYLILYRIDTQKEAVYIVRVVYGRRNYAEML